MPNYKRFSDIPQLISCPTTGMTMPWTHMERWIAEEEKDSNLELDPDFQRGHVWTEEQKTAYIEFCLRGGQSAKDVYFNHPGWQTHFEGSMVLVDGLQRISAVRSFLRDEVQAFGSKYSEFEDKLGFSRTNFTFHVNTLQTREEVLEWYLQMNDGGTPHSREELTRVRGLLEEARVADAAQSLKAGRPAKKANKR